MTITLEIPPETGERLIHLAKSRGLSLDAYLQSVIVQQATASELPATTQSTPIDDADRIIDDLFDLVELPPGVGQGAMRRENWYR